MDDETFERIPWEHLSSKPVRPQVQGRSLVYAGGAALAVAVLAFALLGRGEQAASTMETTVATTNPPSTTLAVVAEATTTTLLSEAALMAVPDVRAEAAAWAEWITEAYFTVDGSATTALAGLLPAGSALPAPIAGQRVFVESARSISVAEEGTSYRVIVLARLLGAVGSAAYERLPDRALAWTLRWEPGGWVVVDLPEEITAPVPLPGPAFATGQVPEPIFSAAGQHGSIIGGSQVGDLWRVVVTVADQFGGSWPVVVWFAPDGSPVANS